LQRCWGWTRNLRRCGREGNWKLFCDDHRRQPVVAIFILVFTVVAGAASIYSAWFSKPANVAKSDYPFVRPTFYDPVAMQWYFFLDLKGNDPVYNVDVILTDEAKPPGSERITRLHYDEIDPQAVLGAMVRGQFPWRTPGPEHEHFSVLGSYRGGSIIQDLRIEHLANQWAIACRVTDGGAQRRMLLLCKDPNFPSGLGYDTSLPACWPDFPRTR
jgi:hypothetical protein